MHRFHPTQFFCLLLTLCLTACTVLAAPDGQPLGIAVADRDNRITWRVAENAIIFDVDSPRGIGRATMLLVAGTYPEQVRLRFHLAGLEELRLAYDTTVVTLSVASTGDHAVQQRVTLGSEPEQEIAADSPYWMKTWMETTPVSAGTSATTSMPLRNGTLEVELPPQFLHTQQTTFSIQWVDFYR